MKKIVFEWYISLWLLRKVLNREATLKINPIRLNWHYIIWYKNFTVISISLIVPFILLAYWNANTLAVMLRRRRLKNRPKLISSNTQRSVTESPDNPTRNVAVALLNVTSTNPVDPEPCSTSTLGNSYNTLQHIISMIIYSSAISDILFMFNLIIFQ